MIRAASPTAAPGYVCLYATSGTTVPSNILLYDVETTVSGETSHTGMQVHDQLRLQPGHVGPHRAVARRLRRTSSTIATSCRTAPETGPFRLPGERPRRCPAQYRAGLEGSGVAPAARGTVWSRAGAARHLQRCVAPWWVAVKVTFATVLERKRTTWALVALSIVP